MAMKSQMLRTCVALLNHPHQNQMAIARRFIQSPFRPISTDFHLPVVDRRHYRTNPPLFRSHPSSEASLNPPPDSPTPTKTVKVVVTGRVNKVGFESWAQENATALGLKGYVYNRKNACVELLCSGDADKVDEMQELCKIGPDCAVITKFVVNPSTEEPVTTFEVREAR